MTKQTALDPVVIPVRVDVPIGVPFKFAGGRAVYQLVQTDEPLTCCAACALSDRRKRRLCASLSCSPTFREDKFFCYVRRIR